MGRLYARRCGDDDNTRIFHVFEMRIGMNLSPLIAQLVEPCTGIAEVRVRVPVQAFLAAV